MSAPATSVQLSVGVAHPALLTDAAAMRLAATAAEELGYHRLWAIGSDVADLVGTIAQAAAMTDRVGLGVGLVAGTGLERAGPDRDGAARALGALGRLGRGRLAVGLTAREPGRTPGESVLDLVAQAVGDGPHRPPVYVGGSNGAGLEVAARRADGWVARDVPVRALAARWAAVRAIAGQHGRDPDGLRLVVPARIVRRRRQDAGGGAAAPGERADYEGTDEEVAGDLALAARGGAHEVVLIADGDPSLDAVLDTCASLAERLARLTPGAPA